MRLSLHRPWAGQDSRGRCKVWAKFGRVLCSAADEPPRLANQSHPSNPLQHPEISTRATGSGRIVHIPGISPDCRARRLPLPLFCSIVIPPSMGMVPRNRRLSHRTEAKENGHIPQAWRETAHGRLRGFQELWNGQKATLIAFAISVLFLLRYISLVSTRLCRYLRPEKLLTVAAPARHARHDFTTSSQTGQFSRHHPGVQRGSKPVQSPPQCGDCGISQSSDHQLAQGIQR